MPHPPERHPQEARAAPIADSRPKRGRSWTAYKTFLTQPNAALVLSFLLLYRVGDIMMFAMSKPLLRDLGIDTSQRGMLNGFSIAATILGSIVGGGDHRAQRPGALSDADDLPAEPGDPALHRAGGLQAGASGHRRRSCSSSSSSPASARSRSRCFRCSVAGAAFSASHFAFVTAVVSLARARCRACSRGRSTAGRPPDVLHDLPSSPACPAWSWCCFVPKTPIEPAPA